MVIGEGILPMFRCATAKDVYAGDPQSEMISCQKNSVSKNNLFLNLCINKTVLQKHSDVTLSCVDLHRVTLYA